MNGPGQNHAVRFIEYNAKALARLDDMIFYYGELGMQEFRTSKLLAGTLERAGFDVVRNLSGFSAGFMASFGSGDPIIALHCEFDANPGNSQVPGISHHRARLAALGITANIPRRRPCRVRAGARLRKRLRCQSPVPDRGR
jgi:aminobenzoyl-glutamate utilization protein B